MLGLMKVPDELIPILDFEQILYNQRVKDHEKTRVVVVQTKELYIGLLVLYAKGIIDIPKILLTTSGLMAHSRTPYFTSVANLENRMITIVDPEILSKSLSGMDEIGDYVDSQLTKEV